MVGRAQKDAELLPLARFTWTQASPVEQSESVAHDAHSPPMPPPLEEPPLLDEPTLLDEFDEALPVELLAAVELELPRPELLTAELEVDDETDAPELDPPMRTHVPVWRSQVATV